MRVCGVSSDVWAMPQHDLIVATLLSLGSGSEVRASLPLMPGTNPKAIHACAGEGCGRQGCVALISLIMGEARAML